MRLNASKVTARRRKNGNQNSTYIRSTHHAHHYRHKNKQPNKFLCKSSIESRRVVRCGRRYRSDRTSRLQTRAARYDSDTFIINYFMCRYFFPSLSLLVPLRWFRLLSCFAFCFIYSHLNAATRDKGRFAKGRKMEQVKLHECMRVQHSVALSMPLNEI